MDFDREVVEFMGGFDGELIMTDETDEMVEPIFDDLDADEDHEKDDTVPGQSGYLRRHRTVFAVWRSHGNCQSDWSKAER
jgi:hypothetical protein